MQNRLKSIQTYSDTEQYPIPEQTDYYIFPTMLYGRLLSKLSVKQQQKSPEIYCHHGKSIGFICRNHACLKNQQFVCCSEECMGAHYEHPGDLIGYETFANSLVGLQKMQTKTQIAISTKIRQAMNKLLYLRVTISQYIDRSLQKLKQIMQKSSRLNKQQQTKSATNEQIKDCIFQIKQYRRNQQLIVYNDEQKQQTYNKLKANINQLLKRDVQILQCNDEELGRDSTEKKKGYEYKVEGNIYKIKGLIKRTPKHVDRIKIYLNEDVYGYLLHYIVQ